MPAFHSLKLNVLNHGGLRFLLNEVAENRQRKGMGSSRSEISSLMWFRKGLRIHDNPALEYACRNAKHVYPVFVLDPWFLDPDPNAPSPGSARVGINRIRFLLQSLADLDANLRSRGSRLILFKGNPVDVIPGLLEQWGIKRLCYEFDIEPYAQQRDTFIQDFAKNIGAEVFCPVSHTIFDPREIISKNGGKPPLTYQAFLKLVGMPSSPIGNGPLAIPSVGEKDLGSYPLPTLADLGFDELSQKEASPFFGGETEALKRLGKILKDKKWITEFEKPKGNPADFQNPATTVLSPYLKFGCLSSRFFYSQLKEICGEVKTCTKPPVSLEGQLLWREFFYTVAYGTCNFDKMDGNPICKQIPWTENEYLLSAWRDAKTGYPWIDAIMIQLRTWGWMHHLARHSVACFLTRGDLFVHWEKGRDVFDRLLIDADWAINNGNWMWLSCSAFFSQYHRVYSPISFGKKYDPDGKFVKHFLPILKDMPAKYVYEPWTAPIEVQKKAKCIIGKDYPEPVVCHVDASRECKKKIATAYALDKERNQEQKQAKTKFSNHANKELPKTPKKLRQI